MGVGLAKGVVAAIVGLTVTVKFLEEEDVILEFACTMPV